MPGLMEKIRGKSYEGKSMRLGGGGRFAKAEDEMVAKGVSRKRAGAILASRGRREYGKERYQGWAAAGRRRAK